MSIRPRLLPLRGGCQRADLTLGNGLEQGSGMNKLIFANLVHRPLRSVISVLAVAMKSSYPVDRRHLHGNVERPEAAHQCIGADLVVSPSNASFMNGMSGAAMSAKLAPFLATLPHVCRAAPVIRTSPWATRSRFSMDGVTRPSTPSSRSSSLPAVRFKGRRCNRRRCLGQDRRRPPRW